MNPKDEITLPPDSLLPRDRRFEMMVHSIKDYAIYLLDPQGNITSWNTGAQLFKGYTAEEVMGNHFSLFYTPEDRDVAMPAHALRVARLEGKYEAEGWRVRKDGTRFWAHVIVDPIYDDDGELAGFAKITRDITERKRDEEELDRQRELLNQSQKLEAMGRVTGGVAHDFNNLLTVIRSSAELLRLPSLSPEKRARYVDAIAETAERAVRLTSQLLAFARQQPLAPVAFDVLSRVEGLKEVMETTLSPNIDMQIDIPPDLSAVDADPSQFDTAILNMVINARDAMPNGGTLRVTAHAVSALPPIRRHAGALGDFVAIIISDTGTGIDPAVVGRIFDPFFTTKETNKGTGLGLSQVYGFAKQSGGDVDVSGEPGAGTIFTMYLPAATAPAMVQGREPVAGMDWEAIAASSILLVEDNDTVGRFAKDVLTDLGHKVCWATDATEALEILERCNGFNLVLSDVVMPGMNGIDLAKEIRRRWPDLRVVLTSGYSHVLAGQADHGFEFLQKPYNVESLLTIIRGSSAKGGRDSQADVSKGQLP